VKDISFSNPDFGFEKHGGAGESGQPVNGGKEYVLYPLRSFIYG
jgi:hypothetical protein